jgi:hypothetical protein
MSFSFDDMTTAIESYPSDRLEIEIVDVEVPGAVLNVTEEARFRVKVTNRGPLHIKNLQVKVKALNGAQVKHGGAAAPYGSEFVSEVFDRVQAHGGEALSPGSSYVLKAPGRAQSSRPLVSAELHDWDADLNHILLHHASAVPGVKGDYATRVVRS